MSMHHKIFHLFWINCLLILLFLLTDLHVPINLAIPIFSVIVLVASQRRIGLLSLAACLCSSLTLSHVFTSSETDFFAFAWESRILLLCIIWIATLVSLYQHTPLKHHVHKLFLTVLNYSSLAVFINNFCDLSIWVNQQFRSIIGSAAQVPVTATWNAESQKDFPLFTNAIINREYQWLGKNILTKGFKKRTAEISRINENRRLKVLKRKRTENKLQTAYKRTQDILDSLFVFVGVYSLEGILLEINRASLDAAKVRKSDVIGKPFWESYRSYD